MELPQKPKTVKKTTNWEPDWSNPTQESNKGEKAFAGANEKKP